MCVGCKSRCGCIRVEGIQSDEGYVADLCGAQPSNRVRSSSTTKSRRESWEENGHQGYR